MALEGFKLPDVSEDVAGGELATWHVAPDDEVTENQTPAEVKADKTLVNAPSPFDGTVRGLLTEEDEVVPTGDVIIAIQEDGDDEEAIEAADTDAEAAGSEPAEGDDGASGDESDFDGRVFVPPNIRHLAHELDVDLDTVDGSGPSGRVTEGGVRAAADNDDDEDDEPSGLRTIQTSGKSATAKHSEGTSTSASSSAPTESADREQTLAAPATRALAEEEGVNIDTVPATEMRDGEAFVSPETVQEYAQTQRGAQTADVEAVSAEADAGTVTAEATVDAASEPASPETGPGASERVPYKDVCKAIGDRIQRSKYTAPHVTHHDEVDVTELIELREQLKPVAGERGSRLTYMPFVTRAVVAVLKGFPYLDSQLDEENEGIVLHDKYNIDVTAATDTGLLASVVHNADHEGMLGLAGEMDKRVGKTRNRKIAPGEMRGGTFTIADVGGIGDEYAMPTINYPEVAILALGVIKEKPRVVDSGVAPRNALTLSLSSDHRIVDGARGAWFTNRVEELLEDPKLLVLE